MCDISFVEIIEDTGFFISSCDSTEFVSSLAAWLVFFLCSMERAILISILSLWNSSSAPERFFTNKAVERSYDSKVVTTALQWLQARLLQTDRERFLYREFVTAVSEPQYIQTMTIY